MKIVKTLIILFVFISCQKEIGNRIPFIKAKKIETEIDRLNTSKEIEEFIHKNDTNYKKFKLRKIQDFARDERDNVNKILANKVRANQSYTKVDLDNNGYTDLLVIGDNFGVWGSGKNGETISQDFTTIVIMNFNNNYKIIDINKSRFYPIVPKVEYVNNQPFLMIYNVKETFHQNKRSKTESKTKLTFKFGDFIEYNENPKKYNIEKIEYSAGPCFGSCPIFKLEISKNKAAVFNAQHYNFNEDMEQYSSKEEGIFKATISQKEFNELIEILNYIDFSNLQKSYSVTWTDDQSSELKITYDNGKIKTIDDYGLIGTYGLKRTYEMLFNLRKNQNWKQVQ